MVSFIFCVVGGDEAGLTLHVFCRLWDPPDAERQAVFEHLVHLCWLEGLVPPHEIGGKHLVHIVGSKIRLVRRDEEVVAVPEARRALGLWCCYLAGAETHCVVVLILTRFIKRKDGRGLSSIDVTPKVW